MAKFIVLRPIELAPDGASDGRVAMNTDHIAWVTAYNGSTLVMSQDGAARLVLEPFDAVLLMLEVQ